MGTAQPKVFISYSWTVADQVLEFAEQLRNPGGVDVILDKWELKEGQDKYAFMEKAVNDPEVTRVLIICDKSYVEKANAREGGVGDETVIISAEVYGAIGQEKFIPIVFEHDENGEPLLPTYIKTRIYIDLADDEQYGANYEKLLRNLHGKPEYKKPPLSAPPEWLNDENISLSPIRSIVKEVKSYKGGNQVRMDFLVRRAKDEFSAALLAMSLPLNKEVASELVLQHIDSTKPLRDYFLDFAEALIQHDMLAGEILSDIFEALYNDTTATPKNLHSHYPANLEVGYFFVWEALICVTALLLHYERYKDLNAILTRTYFLDATNGTQAASLFSSFYSESKLIECKCKPESDTKNLYTLAGEIVVKRVKKPIITEKSVAEADLVLYQMACALGTGGWVWFPKLYCYRNRYSTQTIWSKMLSKRHCEKLYPLFGVTSIEGLKELVGKCAFDRNYRHRGSFDAAPNILNSINVEEIATMN